MFLDISVEDILDEHLLESVEVFSNEIRQDVTLGSIENFHG